MVDKMMMVSGDIADRKAKLVEAGHIPEKLLIL